jgi:hypothetical protein
MRAQPRKIDLPKDAVIWPTMGVSSWITKRGGAFRLYVLARSLDPRGAGHIDAETLRAAAVQLGVKPRTFAYWLADALKCEIFEKKRGQVLRIHSQGKVLRILGGRQVDHRKVIIPLKSLFKNGWRARVWATYIQANHNGNPISQKKLEELTGIPVRTQKSLNRYVSSRRQIGITNWPADHVTGMNEYSARGKAFVFIDPQRKNSRVAAIHLPSVKTVSNKDARIANVGRRSAILAHLQRHGLACTIGQLSTFQQADNRTVKRLFYSTPKTKGKTPEQTRRAMSRYEKTVSRLTQPLSRQPGDPDRVFLRRGKRDAWDVIFL